MIVRTRKEFGRLINKMENPVMSEHDFGHWADYCSSTVMVKDSVSGASFYLPTSKYRENISLKSWEIKVQKNNMKYERWMYYFCGNHCITKLHFTTIK